MYICAVFLSFFNSTDIIKVIKFIFENDIDISQKRKGVARLIKQRLIYYILVILVVYYTIWQIFITRFKFPAIFFVWNLRNCLSNIFGVISYLEFFFFFIVLNIYIHGHGRNIYKSMNKKEDAIARYGAAAMYNLREIFNCSFSFFLTIF